MDKDDVKQGSPNRDPITGAPGSHPIGTGLGAAAGGIAAAAVAGTLAAGPVGTVVGTAIGAVVGGLGGKAIAEQYDPTIEEAHWRDHYEREPYYREGLSFDDYAPAYRLGGESRVRYADRQFDEVERDLAGEYDRLRGASRLEWEDAKQAARAAWNRLDAPTTRRI